VLVTLLQPLLLPAQHAGTCCCFCSLLLLLLEYAALQDL
jgi:hypothetical protein